MFAAQNWCFRWSLILSTLAVLPPFLSGCGGGGGGPQVNPTPTPTTVPIASGRIGWMSDRDGTFHIYVMNGDGTGQVRLTQNSGLERSPSWSKDGKRLLFSYSPDKSLAGAEIYSIKSDGTGLTRLTNNSVEDNSPSFSPDGQYIAWSQATGSTSSAVFTAKSDGSDAQKLSATGEFARTPSFDPQGRVVLSSKNVAVSGSKARYQIVRLNRDGSGRTQLSNTTSNLYSPTVSPDGNTLLYVDDASSDFQLYTSPVASFVPQLLSFSNAGDSDPSWTPDGRILFSSLRDGNAEIYVAKLDGSAPTRLTSNPTTDRLPVAIGPSAK
ncbi:protein TolB [Abditibacteriota bacterium]|nr:protein TolB [Abditibacteriota bacterium]